MKHPASQVPEVDRLRLRVKSLKRALTSHKNEIANLKEENAKKQKRIEELDSYVEDLRQEGVGLINAGCRVGRLD